MDEDTKVNIGSIILFIIFAMLLVIAFIVMNNSTNKVKKHVGRYISSANINSKNIDILKEAGINTNGKINYELILKNNDTFVLYIDAVEKSAYTGNYDKGINKVTLKTYKLYNFDKNCYHKRITEVKLTNDNNALNTSDITGSNLSFIKYDTNTTKYDEDINNIYLECGTINF